MRLIELIDVLKVLKSIKSHISIYITINVRRIINFLLQYILYKKIIEMLKYYNIEINIMQEIPEPVRAALEELKSRHRHHLQLRRCEGGYYVSEATSKWDPEKGRNRAISIYVGKITDNGEFIEPVRKRSSTMGVENLDQYMKLSKERATAAEKRQFESEYEPLILKELSTNPRDGVAAISKRIGLPYSTTQYWIKKLEQKYGIKYVIEGFRPDKFGLFRFFAVAKFTGQRPNTAKLKQLLDGNSNIQLALLTRGAYDLFLFFLAKDPYNAETIIYNLRLNPVLLKCPANWYSSYYTVGLGFIPLRESFFDLLEKQVWKRSKEQPRKQSNQIFLREYATIRELNTNGIQEFSKIDNKYKLKAGSAQYTYHKLVEEQMINRVTITMDNPPIKNVAVIIIKQNNLNSFYKKRREWLMDTILESNAPLNKYILSGDIGAPYGVMHIAPIYKEGDLEKIEDNISKLVKGAKIKVSIVTETLTGNLGYRKIDTTKTWVYNTVVKEFNHEPKPNSPDIKKNLPS